MLQVLQLTRVRSQGIALHPVTQGRKEQRRPTSQETCRSVCLLLSQGLLASHVPGLPRWPQARLRRSAIAFWTCHPRCVALSRCSRPKCQDCNKDMLIPAVRHH